MRSVRKGDLSPEAWQQRLDRSAARRRERRAEIKQQERLDADAVLKRREAQRLQVQELRTQRFYKVAWEECA